MCWLLFSILCLFTQLYLLHVRTTFNVSTMNFLYINTKCDIVLRICYCSLINSKRRNLFTICNESFKPRTKLKSFLSWDYLEFEPHHYSNIQWYPLIQSVPGGNDNILGGHIIGHSKQKVYMYTCLTPNDFKDRPIHRTVADLLIKRIVRIVPNIGTYCSRDTVGTVYPVQYIFENFSVNINELFNSCEDMAFCSSECVLTFLYAGYNIHYEFEQFVSCIHFCSVHFTLHPAPLTRI